MECDLPSKHSDGKLPILDMAVWMSEGGNVLYKHFEKKMASRLTISERSAHSSTCKRSVHVQELVRRMWNTSTELDWDQHVAPVCSDYCGRLYAAGYSEQYRKNVVKHAVNIWDKKIHDNDTGVSPLNRPKGYRKLERRKEKKKNWTTKGGYCAPIIVPATPGA